MWERGGSRGSEGEKRRGGRGREEGELTEYKSLSTEKVPNQILPDIPWHFTSVV
jgi:hypothetical protein